MTLQKTVFSSTNLTSLVDIQSHIATAENETNILNILSFATFQFDEAELQQNKCPIHLYQNWHAEIVKLESGFQVDAAINTDVLIVALKGGFRVTNVASQHEFAIKGEQFRFNLSEVNFLHPIDKMDTVLLVISENDKPSVNFATYEGSGEAVEPPYYWGYDERYAQTYAEGGSTWETSDPNDIVVSLLPKLIKNKTQELVIDLGCGEGRDSLWMAEKGYKVLGVDVSATAIAHAKSLVVAKGIKPIFIIRDVIFLRGIENESASVALNMGCLHMLDSQTDRAGHLKRVFEILKSGGTFVVNHCKEKWLKGFWSIENYDDDKEYNFGDIIPRRIRLDDGSVKTVDMKILHHKVCSTDELKQELRNAGFEQIEVLEEDEFTFGNSAILICRKP